MKRTTVKCDVFGIDFSADAKRSGSLTWVASGRVVENQLEICSVKTLSDLLQVSRKRDVALPALAKFIGDVGNATVGIDFPFSIPAQLINEPNGDTFVSHFADRFSDPESFRAYCQSQHQGEFKRRTDRHARTPFSPYNLRMYTMTYHGIREVLARLVVNGSATVAPMQNWRKKGPNVIEICPSSTLKRLGLPTSGYKGAGSCKRETRQAILKKLVASGQISLQNPEMGRMVVENKGGDALDAIIAALPTYEIHSGTRSPADNLPPESMIEGWVYF